MKITKKLITNNFTKGNEGNRVKEITIHHTAGNILLQNLYTMFNNSKNQVSSHYGIKDNDVYQFIEENNISWCNSNWESNKRAITIEVSNSKGSPNWEISDKSYNSLIDLVYEIAKRHNLLPLVYEKTLTYHSMYSSTECPGPYLKGKLKDLIKKVNSKDDLPKYKKLYRVRKIWSDAKTQIGAYESLDNAKKACDLANPYSVYDESGKQVYPK